MYSSYLKVDRDHREEAVLTTGRDSHSIPVGNQELGVSGKQRPDHLPTAPLTIAYLEKRF